MQITTRDFAPHTVRTGWTEGTTRVTLTVSFGLHYMKANRSPHFAITAVGKEDGREAFGGCCHDVIAQRFPDLADMIALHLSDIDGTPMHAVANGEYFLAGGCMLGGTFSADTVQHPQGLAGVVAEHFRIPVEDAHALRMQYAATPEDERKAFVYGYVASCRPRWQAEAAAAIRKYGLGIHGDMQKTPAEVLASLDAPVPA